MEWSTNAEIVKVENEIRSLLIEMIENQEKMIKLLEKENDVEQMSKRGDNNG